MNGLLRSEVRKIRTTNGWWIFALCLLVLLGMALWLNLLQADDALTAPPPEYPPDLTAEELAQYKADDAMYRNQAGLAANVFTSGQYFGGLFMLLLGVLMVTNEFHHQTATATFLTTPQRTRVVRAKVITALLAATACWAAITVVNLAAGSLYYQLAGFDPHLGDWKVQRAILLNLVVIALWAVVGLGFGALIRNQIAATIVVAVLYVLADQVIGGLFFILSDTLDSKAVLRASVLVPSVAAKVLTSPVKTFAESPPFWVGGLVLLAYGMASASIGSLILRRRDIS